MISNFALPVKLLLDALSHPPHVRVLMLCGLHVEPSATCFVVICVVCGFRCMRICDCNICTGNGVDARAHARTALRHVFGTIAGSGAPFDQLRQISESASAGARESRCVFVVAGLSILIVMVLLIRHVGHALLQINIGACELSLPPLIVRNLFFSKLSLPPLVFQLNTLLQGRGPSFDGGQAMGARHPLFDLRRGLQI